MATLGSTTKPTGGQEWYGLNTTNHFAIALTMPSGGPWSITKVGVWVAGQSEACTMKVCVWRPSGSLLGSSASFTAGSQSFGSGNSSKEEHTLSSPVEVDGGDTIWVGFARDPADNVQFGTRSGTRYQKYDSSWPDGMGSASSHSDKIGAYIVYESANSAPNAPTNLSPSGSEVVDSGTSPTVSGTRSDPDSGDYISRYEIRVKNDAESATVYDDIIDPSGTPTSFSKAITLPSAGRWFKWQARTRDKGGLWGDWSALQRFYANTKPNTPSVNKPSTSTKTPTLTGAYSDPDGDSSSAVQIQVVRSSNGDTMWDSGYVATVVADGASFSKTYGGTALDWDVTYKWRARVKDSNGAESGWSSYQSWTPSAPPGPDNCSPTDTSTKQDTLTPTLTIGHSANFRNDEIQVRTQDNGGGTLIWDKAKDGSDYANTTSKARTYAGSALSWGETYWWRARVELSSSGSNTEWSNWMPFYVNAVPAKPSNVRARDDSDTDYRLDASGVYIVTTDTPLLEAAYNDADLATYGDVPSQREVEIYDDATSSLVHSDTDASPAFSSPMTYTVPAATLTTETTYKMRWRFTDDAGQQSAWSSYVLFKVTEGSSVTGLTPSGTLAVPAAATSPQIDVTWTFTSPGGKSQGTYQVRMYEVLDSVTGEEALVYDSGEVGSSDQSHSIPAGTASNGTEYRIDVTAFDTEGV